MKLIKKVTVIALLGIFLISNNYTTSSAMESKAMESKYDNVTKSIRYYVNGTNVNLRSGPGTNYSSKGQLTNGAAFDVDTISSGWAYGTVKSGANTGIKGWVLLTYLR